MVRYNNLNFSIVSLKYYFLFFLILNKLSYKPYHWFQSLFHLFFAKLTFKEKFLGLPHFLNTTAPHRGILFKLELKPIWALKKKSFFYKRKRLLRLKKKFRKIKNLNLSFFKYYHLSQKYLNIKYSSFSIFQRIFLSKKFIKNRLWRFFYAPTKFFKINSLISNKVNEITRLKDFFFKQPHKLYMLNANKPLITKMRKARYAHWDFRLKGKLNEWRYNKLLGVDLNYITKDNYYTFLNLILLRCFSFILSWRQILKLHNFNLILHNGFFMGYTPTLKCGDIVELPIFIKKSTYEDNKYFSLIVKKSKKRAYIEFLHSKKGLKRAPKHYPKIFKKLPLGFLKLGAFLDFDSSTNSFAVITNITNYKHNIHYNILYTSVLTLQNWRYRFD